MSGYHDSASRLWLLRIGHGLNVHGASSEAELLEHLVRVAMTEGDSDERKQELREALERGLTHMDEPEEEEPPEGPPFDPGLILW